MVAMASILNYIYFELLLLNQKAIGPRNIVATLDKKLLNLFRVESWKFILNFSAWTERPVDSKLAGEYLSNL